MKLILMTVASANEEWASEAKKIYQKKISHFLPLEFAELKPTKSSRSQAQQKQDEESEKILKNLKSDDFVIVFDERGKKFDSAQFAKKLELVMMSGKKRCVFLIGGAFGFSEQVRTRANLMVCLSDMVYNHLVAQTVALEQIYRAFTIIKNIPYHNI